MLNPMLLAYDTLRKTSEKRVGTLQTQEMEMACVKEQFWWTFGQTKHRQLCRFRSAIILKSGKSNTALRFFP